MAKGKRPRTLRIENQQQLNDFLWTVHEDLSFLRSVDFNRPTRTTVRISASIVRRLLSDEMYLFAWKILDASSIPKIECVDLSTWVSKIDPKYIQYAYAGGAPTAEAQHRGFVLLSIPQEESQEVVDSIKQALNDSRLGEKSFFTVPEFCSSPCVVAGAAHVSRLGLVRYVANKLGGVHWDNHRSEWIDPVA